MPPGGALIQREVAARPALDQGDLIAHADALLATVTLDLLAPLSATEADGLMTALTKLLQTHDPAHWPGG